MANEPAAGNPQGQGGSGIVGGESENARRSRNSRNAAAHAALNAAGFGNAQFVGAANNKARQAVNANLKEISSDINTFDQNYDSMVAEYSALNKSINANINKQKWTSQIKTAYLNQQANRYKAEIASLATQKQTNDVAVAKVANDKAAATAAAAAEAQAQATAQAAADQAAMEETNRARAASEAQAKAVEDKAKADMAETERARKASEAVATAKAAEDKAKAAADQAAMEETTRARAEAEATAKAAEDKAKAEADAAAMAETNRARAASEAEAKAAEDRANYEMAETNRARAASEEAARIAEETGGDIDSTYTTPGTGAFPGGDDNTAIAEKDREEDDIDSTYTTPGVGAYPGGDDSTAPIGEDKTSSEERAAIDEEREGSGNIPTPTDPGIQWQLDYDALMGDESIRAHWETIQKWRNDQRDSYAKTRGTSINRMAGGGMQTESEQWNLNLGAIDARHDKAMAGYEDSATMGIIKRWIDKVRIAEPKAGNTEFSRSGITRSQYDERSTDDFMSANFGTLGGSVSASKAEKSGVAAAQRRAPPRAVQTASPWWG